MKLKHPFLTAKVDRLLGPVMAGALAVATAFFFLAMPGDLMGWLLVTEIDAATRLFVALVAALVAGAGAYALFTWLDYAPKPPVEDEEEWDFDFGAAKVATRGDAPPRPIFADTDLGAVPPADELVLDAPADEDALLLELQLTPMVEEALAPDSDQASIEQASLDELMRRLEAGIAGKGSARVDGPPAGERQQALRTALSELQRMASRHR